MTKRKSKGIKQTAVLGALDVFQGDNKDHDNVNGNENVSSSKSTTPSPQSAADLKDSIITNGTCERCLIIE